MPVLGAGANGEGGGDQRAPHAVVRRYAHADLARVREVFARVS
jgi:hypothetical protein